ncbi:MAG: class I SAM-dependent methyltransferase [Clostridia bacterium]|nr:class I SAM-dependent methyltransferase [Clostridia bacterium]
MYKNINKEKVVEDRYYLHFGAACVRGQMARQNKLHLLGNGLDVGDVFALSAQQCQQILQIGKQNGVDLHLFKKTSSTLPRISKVMGFLKGVGLETLVDVGTGRGAFLLPFLQQFPWVQVTSVEISPSRVQLLQDLSRGGVGNLSVVSKDICQNPLPPNSADVVTLLEVLEHIPNVADAILSACSIAKKYVVVSVPSKEDNNPEHIHLLTKPLLTQYFGQAGVTNLQFDGVNGHLVMIAKKEQK